MLNFKNDYHNIAHPLVLKRINEAVVTDFNGYGEDDFDEEVRRKFCKIMKAGDNPAIHFLVGGTLVNKILISHALSIGEGVIACRSAHINVHETGAIEDGGHKILCVESHNGKVWVKDLEEEFLRAVDHHMVKPKMVYISNVTETGSVYTKEELLGISNFCKKYNLYLYLDGARLPKALVSPVCDYDLSFIYEICDAFSFGGAKGGLLLGEALIIKNEEIKKNFIYSLKSMGGLVSKGFVLSLMFDALIRDDLYLKIAASENALARLLSQKLAEKGYKSLYPVDANHVFIKITKDLHNKLQKEASYEVWSEEADDVVIRLITSFSTTIEEVDALVELF